MVSLLIIALINCNAYRFNSLPLARRSRIHLSSNNDISPKNNLKQLLSNLESQLDEGTTNIIIIQSSNEFEKACDDVVARIKDWKVGTFELSADEVKWAKDKITWIKQKHRNLLSNSNDLNNDITELRGRLRNEEEQRKSEIKY